MNDNDRDPIKDPSDLMLFLGLSLLLGAFVLFLLA